MFKRSSLLYSSSGTFTASTVNAVGGPFYFRSQTVRRGCPFVVYLSLLLAVWSCRVVWLVCMGRRTSCDSCVCVFFPFILDIKFVGRTNRGHTGGRPHRVSHPPSFCYRRTSFCPCTLTTQPCSSTQREIS